MKVKKKYDEGGMFETSRATQRKLRRAAKKSQKRQKRRQDIIDEGTPSNPRFMMGAPTRVNGAVPPKPEDEKKKKKAECDQSARPSWCDLWYSAHAPAICRRIL